MTNFSKTSLSTVEDGPQIHPNASTSSGNGPDSDVFGCIFMLLPFICIIGLVGNGIVICLLGFHIKWSPFTTHILNLAVADFGVLLFFGLNFTFILINGNGESSIFYSVTMIGAIFMHNASQLLLTTISIDRCVCVLFPIWHRCHRPPYLSPIVCALVWALSCLPSVGLAITHYFTNLWAHFLLYALFSGAVLCLPLVAISTAILLFKVFCKSQQPRRGRLLTIVLLTLLFFLIFAFPLNTLIALHFFTSLENFSLVAYGYLGASLNSCINPMIYYMGGRKKGGQQRQSLKVVLRRAFKEEEEHGAEHCTTALRSLSHLRNCQLFTALPVRL